MSEVPVAPLALGLVGAGRWGRTLARVVAGLPGLELRAVASRNPESAERLAPSCRVVREWSALLAMDLDGLLVATPPAHHRAPALAAIEARLPVLIEKPLTLSLAEADELVEAARTAGAVAAVDHTQLFAPGIAALARRLRVLGPPRRMFLQAGGWGPFRAEVPVLWDWAAHDVAIALHLLDAAAAEVVSSDVRRLPAREGGRAESVRLQLRVATAAGAVPVAIRVANVLPAKERWVEVHAAGAQLSYREYPRPHLVERDHRGAVRTHALSAATGPLDAVLLAFAARVRSRSADPSSLELGRAVVRVLSEAEAVSALG